MKATARMALALTATCGMPGCAPTETGNPGRDQGTVVIALTAHTTDVELANIGASAGGIGVSSARLFLRSLMLTPCDPGNVPTRVEVSARVELIGGSRGIELPAGEHCALAVAIGPPANAPDGGPANGNTADGGTAGSQADGGPHASPRSFEIEAERADGAVLRIESSTALSLSVEPASPPLPLADGATAFFAVDLAHWLAGLNVDALTLDPMGHVVVDETTNADLLHQAEVQLATAASLHFDADGDGVLSPEELHDVAASHPGTP